MNRKEAAKWWNEAMYFDKYSHRKGNKWHVGLVEIRAFLDIIYGGPPTCEEECVYGSWTLMHKEGKKSS